MNVNKIYKSFFLFSLPLFFFLAGCSAIFLNNNKENLHSSFDCETTLKSDYIPKKIEIQKSINTKYCLKLSFFNNLDITDDLSKEVEEQLKNFGDIDVNDLTKDLDLNEQKIFSNDDFFLNIKKIISGENSLNFSSILGFVGSLLSNNFPSVLGLLALITIVAILSSLLLQIRGKNLNKPLGDIIHFATFAVIVVLVLNAVLELVKITSGTLDGLKNQMEICFPLLLTLMASLGSTTSVAIYQPVVAILCGAIMQIFTKILIPIFSLCIIFSVLGNLTSSVKLSKFTKFLESSFKYIIGFSFTIFSAFLTISGIMAGSFDGVSIRATKFAVKSYIPIVGGYLSDGFSLIMASSVLIKNAIGYSGLIVMFLTIISPILKIIILKLGLMLVSGIIESVADARVTSFVSGVSKSLSMLSSVILAFSFAYLICVGLIMCSSNVV